MPKANIGPNPEQRDFDKKYITSNEITEILGVNRSAVFYARNRGQLPNPVIVHGTGTFIWNRAETWPYIERWAQSLASRRQEDITDAIGNLEAAAYEYSQNNLDGVTLDG